MPPRGRQSAAKQATPLKEKDADSTAGTPNSTRSGRVVKKPELVSRHFKHKSVEKGPKKKVTNITNESDDEEEDAHEPTGLTSSEDNDSSGDDDGSEDDYGASDSENEEELRPASEVSEDESDMDSDDLDDAKPKAKKSKRKASSSKITKNPTKKKSKTSRQSEDRPKKNFSHEYIEGYDDEDDDMSDTDLEEGQEIAGRIYPAPKTGQVPPGRISKNTLNFLKNLQVPERNDRDWFKSHEPAFRQAEKEWQTFVGTIQIKIHEVDDEVPILPPKDIIHRIYRDVRFSSDKTPYKRSLSFTTSRGGRKGAWASYHLGISPNGRTLIAGGIWMPDKNQTASIRQRLLDNPDEFRGTIGEEKFVKWFGEAKEKKGMRSNVFGSDDALKVAPKGVDKGHKDIDLLKLRTIAVSHYFTDEQVLDPGFQDKVQEVARSMVPFIRLLNAYITSTS